MRPFAGAGASKPAAQPEPRAVRTEVPSWSGDGPGDEHGGRQRQRLAVPRGNAPSVPPIVRVPSQGGRRLASRCASNGEVLVVGLGGIEPPTSPLSGVRSNRLSYSPESEGSGYSAGPSSFTVISTPPKSSAKML
jgi:hypothetical protein